MRYLDIIEVTQKQKYIFQSNRLKENILRSNRIAWITDPRYLAGVIDDGMLFDPDRNVIYSGGGHIVLEFPDEESGKTFNKQITKRILDDYPDVGLYVCLSGYDETLSPGENLRKLTEKLERKKSIRKAAFHQGTFGIEKIDRNTLEVVRDQKTTDDFPDDITEALVPDGYVSPDSFEKLGGSKGDSSFIAVVHIDGNSMGKRVSDFYEKNKSDSWDDFRKKIKEFSEGIAEDFKEAFREMSGTVAEVIMKGGLGELDLKLGELPLRRIITSGDDICFVSEGRIGIECARIFIDRLSKKKNKADGNSYTACAGIAIVHQKYPFFRAYELSESLCSNAKRFCATLDPDTNGARLSAVDWHISFGELRDSVDEINDDYRTRDGGSLRMRPYIIDGEDAVKEKEKYRSYDSFRNLMREILQKEDNFARSKIKNLRGVMKQGETETRNYIRFNKLDEILTRWYYGIFEKADVSKIGSGEKNEGKLMVETADGENRYYLFDAIELMDTFCFIDDEGRD